MNSKLFLIVSVLLTLSVLLSACGPQPTPERVTVKETVVVAPTPVPPVEGKEGTLVSAPVDVAPIVDGNSGDAAWTMTPETVLKIATYGNSAFDMKVKSVYTADVVYFLFQYPDSNMEVFRNAWAYDPAAKTWNHLGDDFGDEDEFGLWWNMTMPNYAAKGCFQACHVDKMIAPTGTNADDWRWNSVRSNVMGWGRDFIMTDNPDADPAGGFTKDEGFETNRGYANNDQDLNGATVPAYWKPFSGAGGIIAGDPRYLLQSEIDSGVAKKITEFNKGTGVLTDETGATVPSWVQIPGYILSLPSGPSWNDITAKGNWLDGVWTVEMARKLDTGHADDVSFKDLTATYYFDGYVKTRLPGESAHGQIPTTPFIFAPKP